MSTSRDFRINAASLQAAMEQAATTDEESGDSDANADSDNQVICWCWHWLAALQVSKCTNNKMLRVVIGENREGR